MTDKPITFTDGDGVEWTLIAGRAAIPPESDLLPVQRDAAPDDLARAGYEVPLTVRGHAELLLSLGYHVENPKACDSEIFAHRMLERYLRRAWDRMPYPLRDEVDTLLKAVDEARK